MCEIRTPQLSVIMPVYNEERFIKEAIDSILTQTFKDYEFLIIDDGSTDKTPAILSSYSDERITVITQNQKGLTIALNRGLKVAKGKYIARMDGNDISLPDRFSAEAEFLDYHQNIGLVGTHVVQMDENGEFVKVYSYPAEDEDIRCLLWQDCPFCHSSVMFRKECIDTVGGYRDKIGPAEDYDLWFRISESFQVANLTVPLHMIRIDSAGISISRRLDQIRSSLFVRKLAHERRGSGKDSLDALSDQRIQSILDEMLPRTHKNVSKVRFSTFLWLAEVSYCTKNYKRSGRWLRRAVLLDPVSPKAWLLGVKLLLYRILPEMKIERLKKSYRKLAR